MLAANSAQASDSSWTVKWTKHAQFMSFETDKTVKMNGILLRRHPKYQRRNLKDHRRHPKDQRPRPKNQRRHHLRINVLMYLMPEVNFQSDFTPYPVKWT